MEVFFIAINLAAYLVQATDNMKGCFYPRANISSIAVYHNLDVMATLVFFLQTKNISSKYRNALLMLPEMQCPYYFLWDEMESSLCKQLISPANLS